MIEVNGKRFAEKGEAIEPGFVGFATRLKRTIKFFDLEKNLVGILSKYGVLACATKLNDGKYWYSYGNVKLIGETTLGMGRKLAERLAIETDFDYKRNETAYQYK